MPEEEKDGTGADAPPTRASSRLGAESLGLALLAAALLFNFVTLRDEARVGVLPVNDDVFHSAAVERLGEAIAAGEPFLDPWVADWGLGFPVWRSYQPIPHVAAAPFVLAASPARKAEAYANFAAVVRGLLPAAVWGGARLFGLTPLASGLSALLVLMPSGPSGLGNFGLGSASYAYLGPGVYTQQFAFLLLPFALGAVRRALDSGRGKLAASALLAATLLSHIVFGYVAALAAVLLCLVGPSGERSRRIARLPWLAAGSILLTAWFTVPLILSRAEINHSRWEPPWKWDSFGARTILSVLFDGTLLDSGRLPILTALLGLALTMAFVLRGSDTPRRLLFLTLLLFALFLGRDTWGHLLLLLGVPGDLHLHRMQAAFELSACLLVAWSLDTALSGLRNWKAWTAAAAAVVVLASFGLALKSRAEYLRASSASGRASLQGFRLEKADLEAAFDDVRRLQKERPGRMSSGPAAGWGAAFKTGEVKTFIAAALERFDSVSMLFHAMSRTGDQIFQRALDDPGHDDLFGIRAVVAPAGQGVPGHYREAGRHGRFVVYEASRSGYFGLGDVIGRYMGPKGTEFDASASWLASPVSRAGLFVALRGGPTDVPSFGRWEPIPPIPMLAAVPRGEVIQESAGNGRWRAAVRLQRKCWVVLKVTWFPDLHFTVDGAGVPAIQVTPGFPAVAVEPGEHVVEAVYRPSPLKPALFGAGLTAFALLALASRTGRAREAEELLARLAARAEELAAARITVPALAVAGLLVLSCRALFRGLLVNAHDATIYPPRLVEFARSVVEGHLPPVWAADLGNGFGQPLFAFAPPLVYAAQLPFHLLGLRLADAVQLGAFVLVAAGAWAVHQLAREIPATMPAAVGAAGFWLFVPYLHTDLFVRGAFAEAAALAVVPLAFLAFWRFLGTGWSSARLLGASAAIAAVILGHNAVALLFVPFLGLATLAACRPRQDSLQTLGKGIAAIALGLALSAFFWVPAMAENEWAKTFLLKKEGDASFWALHFPTFGQLLYSPWGFGFSVPGPADGMSFMVGPLHLLAGAVGLWAGWRRGGRARSLAVTAATGALVGLFLASPASFAIWKAIPLLQYFIYPWRALVLPAVLLPVLAALALDALPRRLAVAATAVVVVLNLSHTEPNGYQAFDDEYYAPESLAARGINTSTFEEYEPRWVERRAPRTELPLSAPTGIEFVDAEENATRRQYTVRMPKPAEVEAAIFWYPGWAATVDGRTVPTSIVPGRGTFSFPVEEGAHRIDLRLTRTPLRTGSLLVTLVAACVLAGLVVAERRGAAGR